MMRIVESQPKQTKQSRCRIKGKVALVKKAAAGEEAVMMIGLSWV